MPRASDIQWHTPRVPVRNDIQGLTVRSHHGTWQEYRCIITPMIQEPGLFQATVAGGGTAPHITQEAHSLTAEDTLDWVILMMEMMENSQEARARNARERRHQAEDAGERSSALLKSLISERTERERDRPGR